MLIKIEEDQIRDLRGRADREVKNRQETERKLKQAEKDKTEAEEKLQQVKQEAVKLTEELELARKACRQQEDKIRKLEVQKFKMENSVSYKLGRCMTAPFRKVRMKRKQKQKEHTL